jgi:transposase
MEALGQERLIEVEKVEAPDRAPVGQEKTFRPYDPNQVLLLSPVLAEWVPEGDLAHFVSDLVETGTLDLKAIYHSYEEERGFPPYDPRLMVKLLLYGYANAVMSSRKLERATYRDVAVRMLCADQHPDFRSIARFRQRHLEALGELFVQTLRLCRRAQLVELGTLALDGTRLRANASRRKAMSYGRMVRAEAQLEVEIASLRQNMDKLLLEAQAIDAAEDERFGADRRGDELPVELRRREQRLARIREAKQALEVEAREREAARRAELARQDKRPRWLPDRRDPFAPKPRAQRNFTDPDSKIMKTSDGSYHQCYSGQAMVDEKAQVIVVAEVSNQAADAPLLGDALRQLDENLEALEAELPKGAVLTADAGYFSQENVTTCEQHGLDPFLATGRFKHAEPQPPAPRGPIPRGATPKQRMARKIRTKKGRATYARRKAIVEPVFGQIHTVQDGRRLLLRGMAAARAQWRFHCGIHNLLKLHRAGGLALLGTG